jgi:predicted DNA-binding protein (UPF0251 family)
MYVLDAANGLSAKESAAHHGVSLHAVNNSLKSAKETLGATTIAHAVALAIKVGEFSKEDVRHDHYRSRPRRPHR